MTDIAGQTLAYTCQPDADNHCLTCGDEAVAVKVMSVDREQGLAFCSLWSDTGLTEEIDITLIENVTVGDILLAHAGVAIALQEKGQVDE